MAVTAKQFAKLHSQSSIKAASANLIKCALFTSACAVSQASDTLISAAPYTTNQVAAANGYATGGAAVGTNTCITAALVTTLDATDPSWAVTGAGFTFRYAVFYDTVTGVVLSYMDMGADVAWTTPGAYSIALPATGIAQVTVA